MDRFVKRPADKPAGPSSSKRSKQAKQGNVTASTRVAEFGKSSFYADNGKLFCRACYLVVDHIRNNHGLPSGVGMWLELLEGSCRGPG